MRLLFLGKDLFGGWPMTEGFAVLLALVIMGILAVLAAVYLSEDW